MSLMSNETKDLYGVIRNIMLQPIHFPTWTFRVYLEKPTPGNDSTKTLCYPAIPDYFSFKLERLPVQIAYVNTQDTKVDPSLWPALGMEDESVDYLLVRKPTSRLSDRDAAVVHEWMNSGKVVHVIRDHPKHTQNKIVPGLWGVNARKLRTIMSGQIRVLLETSINETEFLNRVFWPEVTNRTFCHDSLIESDRCNPFPIHAINQTKCEYLGQEFGPLGEFDLEEKIGQVNC